MIGKCHSTRLQLSAQLSVIFRPSSHDQSQLQCSSGATCHQKFSLFVCLFVFLFADCCTKRSQSRQALSFFGLLFFFGFFFTAALSNAVLSNWCSWPSVGEELSCGYADASARRVYIIGSGSAVRVAPAPSGFIFFFFCVCHRKTKKTKTSFKLN